MHVAPSVSLGPPFPDGTQLRKRWQKRVLYPQHGTRVSLLAAYPPLADDWQAAAAGVGSSRSGWAFQNTALPPAQSPGAVGHRRGFA
jgi:hypothetical protein